MKRISTSQITATAGGLNSDIQDLYLAILKEELVPAMGCTEPIAIAFAAAKAQEVLGVFPERAIAECSGHIIKNVRSVAIPGTDGQVGIEAAVAAGLVAARPDLSMEVLSVLIPDDAKKIRALVGNGFCEVNHLESDSPLHLIIQLFQGANSATVEIKKHHTHIVHIVKNGVILYEEKEDSGKHHGSLTDRSRLNVDDILYFAESVDLASVKPLLEEQIRCNMAIVEEGLTGNYGVGIGQVIRNAGPACPTAELKACTAAASEARMSGCTLPVITNSGSGNQGIACSVPVIVYARSKGCSEDRLLRALVLSNLLTIHQKTLIGRLSAFCGVVSATCSSGAAITWLDGGSPEQVKMTISNTLANASGIICDGAKPSCGAKIACSLDAAFLGHLLAMQHRAYKPGDGILKDDIEKTISAVGRVAHEGMRATQGCILDVMFD